MPPIPPDLLQAWRDRRDGFAPLFLECVMAPALAHLGDVVGRGGTVLDLGSGGGHVADAVRKCGGRTICLDIDREVLVRSRARYPGGQHLAADAARLPLADHSVDAVFCFSVLQYTDRPRALAEIGRVLRPNGRLVLVENLAGNVFARAYRAWRKLARIRYPKRLTPLRHITWSERSCYERSFPGARVDSFCVTSAGLLLFPRIYRADAGEPAGSWARTALAATDRLDAFLVRRFPWMRNAAWILLVRA